MIVRFVEKDWDAELADGLRHIAGQVLFVSPFIKAGAIEPMLGQLGNGRIITRYSQQDFADRVSDIAALRMLLDAGAAVRGIRHLHAKLYVFGSERAIVTSANLTGAGLGRNHEFGLVTEDGHAVADCRRYFDDLWGRAGEDLSVSQLERWESDVARHLAFGGSRQVRGEALEDLGVDIGIPRLTRRDRAAVFDAPVQAFVKLLGQGDRAPLSAATRDEVESWGCHWALAYPASKRPRNVRDDAVMFIARPAEGGDIRVFGRAVGMAHEAGRDDATPDDVARRPWKSRWPAYVRVHHAEFVRGTLGNGVSLGELMGELDHRAFAATARHFSRGSGNTDPRRAILSNAHMELTGDAEAWLTDRLEARLRAHGTILRETLAKLDWPDAPAPAPPSRATRGSSTDDVRALVHEVLATMLRRSPRDFDEHVTRRVCETIEAHQPWLDRYRVLCDERSASIPGRDGRSVVKKSIGRWTKRALNAKSLRRVATPKETTSLIQSYTLLQYSPPTSPNDLVA